MNYPKFTSVSFGSKIKLALGGIIFGAFLIISSIYFLASKHLLSLVRTTGNIKGESIVKTIDKNNIDATIGQFIYTTGSILSKQGYDIDFGLNINGVVYERNVEMYLWYEEQKTAVKENLGGNQTHTNTYSYKKRWSSTPINSQYFEESQKYINPTEWKYESRREYSQEIQLNDFYISKNFKSYIPISKNLSLQKENFNDNENITLANNFIYIGSDFNNPRIGDIRVSYKYFPQNTIVSIIAFQENQNTLGDFRKLSEQNVPFTIIVEGNLTKNELLQINKD